MFVLETIKIEFGRLPQWNCPIPDTDAKSVATEHNEIATAVQSTTEIAHIQTSVKEVNDIPLYSQNAIRDKLTLCVRFSGNPR